MNKYFIAVLIACCGFMFSCNQEEMTSQPSDARLQALPLQAIDPLDNPTNADKVELGRALFWDPILSGNKDVACVSCHHPKNDYAEVTDLSLGVGGIGISPLRSGGVLVKRNSMSVLNTAFNGLTHTSSINPKKAPMFWDNRVSSLEDQSMEPILSAEEMRGNKISKEAIFDTVVNRLVNIPEYVDWFNRVFGVNGINTINIGKAIAAFERTLITPNTRFDQYMRGNADALTNQEKIGMNNFISAGCINCHNGPMFSDALMHVLTVPDNPKLKTSDNGDGKNLYAFRTGSLRQLSNTGPYMHNGVFNTLEDVLAFYDEASEDSQNPNVANNRRDPLLNQIEVDGNQAASIIAFIKSLSDTNFDKKEVKEVPSKLKPGGN